MKDLIQRLTEAIGPSGYEERVREIVRAEVQGYADEVREDPLGNLIVRKGTRAEGGKRIMLAGHMDELGVMVTQVDEKGFARFTTLGFVYRQMVAGARVRFLNGAVGVIGVELTSTSDHVPGWDRYYIDVGAANKETCPVRVGDVGAFDRRFVDMGGRLVSKAMDDRIAVAVMIEALKQVQSSPNELTFVFTVQEEVGLRGSQTAAFGVDPEIGLAIDVTDTGDTPRGEQMEVRLGKGPAVKVMDSYLVTNPKLVRWMARTAEQAGIPYQYEVLNMGGTDAGAINQARAGIPSICLSIPTRYIHSPSEMVDYQDVQNSVRLLVALVSNPVVLE
ncbi:MAG TPA: M42 family metallopeptidase [Anaerolineales bacterium]